MPRLRTKYVELATGVYVARRGDAVHVVTTGDERAPMDEKDPNGVAVKMNWLTEQEVTVDAFAAAVNTVAPESRGQLVNVGTDEAPFLLTQQQAEQLDGIVSAKVAERFAEQRRTAIPVKD